MLKNPDELVKGHDGVSLANLRTDTAEGKAVVASVKRLLSGLGKEKEAVVTIADAEQAATIFTTSKLNGDGIVPPDTIDDAQAQQVAKDLIDCGGAAGDRSGRLGL